MDISHENYLLPSFVTSCLKEVEHILLFLTYPQNFVDFLSEVKPDLEIFSAIKGGPTLVSTKDDLKNHLDCLLPNQLYYSISPKTVLELMKRSESIEFKSDVLKFVTLLDNDNRGCTKLLSCCISQANKALKSANTNIAQNYRLLTGVMMFSLINSNNADNESAKKNLIETYLLHHKENVEDRKDYQEVTNAISLTIIYFNLIVVYYIALFQFDSTNKEVLTFDEDDINFDLEDNFSEFLNMIFDKLIEIEVLKPNLNYPECIERSLNDYILNFKGNIY